MKQVEILLEKDFGTRELDDDFYYHITIQEKTDSILKSGLKVGQSFNTDSKSVELRKWSHGKIFLTERSGVVYWIQYVKDQLFYTMETDPYYWSDQNEPDDEMIEEDLPAIIVVKFPKKLAPTVCPDPIGTEDAESPAYFSTTDIVW